MEMKLEEVKKIRGGEVLKLGSSYYLVGEKQLKLIFKLWNCDKNGKKTGGDVGNVRLINYNFEIVSLGVNKILEEAIEF